MLSPRMIDHSQTVQTLFRTPAFQLPMTDQRYENVHSGTVISVMFHSSPSNDVILANKSVLSPSLGLPIPGIVGSFGNAQSGPFSPTLRSIHLCSGTVPQLCSRQSIPTPQHTARRPLIVCLLKTMNPLISTVWLYLPDTSSKRSTKSECFANQVTTMTYSA